jgi:hypothetical protein
MNSVHGLDRQQHKQLLFGMMLGQSDSQPQLPASVNHLCKHLVDSIVVHASSFRNFVTQFTTMASEKTDCAWAGFVTSLRGEDSKQVAIIIRGPQERVMLALVASVHPQGNLNLIQRLNPPA